VRLFYDGHLTGFSDLLLVLTGIIIGAYLIWRVLSENPLKNGTKKGPPGPCHLPEEGQGPSSLISVERRRGDAGTLMAGAERIRRYETPEQTLAGNQMTPSPNGFDVTA
jgi:hypothetical protein